MSFKFKKILKGIFISLASIILLVLLAIGIVVNFVFTPEKLTPKALELTNDYLDGRLDLESVELTFFSTFPDLEVRLSDGLLLSNESDSLLSFESLDLFLNPISIFSQEKIHVDKLAIIGPVVYASLDKGGVSNWNIMKQDSTTESQSGEVESAGGSDNTFIIDDIEIKNGAVKFDDFTNFFTMDVESVDILGKVSFLNDHLDCDLDLELKNMVLMLQQEPIINPVSIAFHSRSDINLETNRISIDTINLKVVDHDLEIESKGSIEQDSLGSFIVDLENRIFTSNIREALDLIPLRYMDLTGFQGKGEVDLGANIYGKYDENSFPVVDLQLEVEGGEASYQDFPRKIELFETSVGAKIDYLNKRKSMIDLPNLKLVSDGLSLQLRGKITQILTNPHVIFSGTGGLSFKDLLETIPIEGLDAIGKAEFDLNSDLFLSDLVNYNYGKIGISGTTFLTDMDINYLDDSITFKTSKTRLEFGQDQSASKLGQEDARFLNCRIKFRDLALNIRHLADIETKRFNVVVKTTPLEDSTKISPIKANFNLYNGKALFADTLSISGKGLKGFVLLTSAKNKPDVPLYRSNLTGEFARLKSGLNRIGVRNFEYKFQIVQRKNKWPMKGELKFENLNLFAEAFPRKVAIQETSINVATNKITLNNATVRLGKSALNLSGNIYNLQRTINNTSSLKADLQVNSKFLNINQITTILDQADKLSVTHDMASLDTLSSDTAQMETFVVPKNIDFKLKLNLKKVRYSDLVLQGVRGNVFLKNQSIRLNNLKMKTKAADLTASARYVAKNKSSASTRFNIKLTDVDVKNMVEIMPFLDTLLPMTKDFEGIVNLGMRGSAKIGKNMEVNESTLEAVARLEGQNLVLLDGETFQYLAKTLKFKNRDKNTLDTLAVEMAIEGGALEIFPSLVIMDRYRVAVGGIQNLDLTYKYHISVLDSPLPFKTGIDIFGKAEDYDYKITKAKYKYIFSDKAKHKAKVDPEILKRKNEILERIKFE